MDYFRVRNLSRFQHYKKRNPPWVKLYYDCLENYEFCNLPDTSKWHAIAMVLIASRCDNKIPADLFWIKQKAGLQKSPDLQPLLDIGFIERCKQSASNMLATCKQSALSETETETEGERETEAEAESENHQTPSHLHESALSPAGGNDGRPRRHPSQRTYAEEYPEVVERVERFRRGDSA